MADYPAHAESKDRLLRAIDDGGSDGVVRAAERDVALSVSLLRLANQGAKRGSVESTTAAVEALEREAIRKLVGAMPIQHPLDRLSRSGSILERFRLHALAVHRVAERITPMLGEVDGDLVRTAALLHDIGRLTTGSQIAHQVAYEQVMTPEQRIESERTRLGKGHAEAGGELARSWGFPLPLIDAITRHHDAEDGSVAAVVRLADMLAHYAEGRLVDLATVVDVAASVGIEREELGLLMYDLPEPMAPAKIVEPCPLSKRELSVLRLLAQGKVYKQIGAELGLSTSTIRSHLHNIYTRLGVVDRSQAVLLANERGWI